MSTTQGTVKTDWVTLGALICFRLINGFFLQSAFHPDEEWQSTEVAHVITFGFGFLTWEWEKCIALRSVAHPAVFAAMFWMFKQLHLDHPEVIAVSPRLLQSFLAGLTDYGVVQLAKEWYGSATATDSGAHLIHVTNLHSKEGDLSRDRDNLKSADLPAVSEARDSAPAAKVSTGSATREETAIARKAAKADDSVFHLVTRTLLHWVHRYRTAEDLVDVTREASLVCCITLCYLLSWFNFFCLPRTYSSCMETFLNVYSLLFFARARDFGYRKVRTPANIQNTSTLAKPSRTRRASVTPLSAEEGSAFGVRKSSAAVPEDRAKNPEYEDMQANSCTHTVPRPEGTCGLLHFRCSYSPTLYTTLALSCAAVSVVMRPPAACFWSVFCLCKVLRYLTGINTFLTDDSSGDNRDRRMKKAVVFLGLCSIVGIVALGCNFYLDYMFYRKLTFPPLNFVNFNLLMDPGRHFGAYPWHYYLVECPVVVLLTFYPFFVLGLKFWLATIYRRAATCYIRKVHKTGNKGTRFLEIAKYFTSYIISRDDGAALLGTLSSLLLLSLCTHKEYRFMVPFMPILLTYAGIGIVGFINGNTQLLAALSGQQRRPDTLHSTQSKPKGFLTNLAPKQRTIIVLGVFATQLLFSVYFGFFHRRATPRIMRYLRQLPEGSSVFFLSPSHDLPYYSQVHRKIPMGFLDASPRVRREQNFPASWQDRFWAPENPGHNVEFLDTFFVDSPSVQQVPVSPLTQSRPSTTSTIPHPPSAGWSCPAPSSSELLRSLFFPSSHVPTSPPLMVYDADARTSSVSTLPAPRGKGVRGAVGSASATRMRMHSDIYSRIPEGSDQYSLPIGDLLFSRGKDIKGDKHNIEPSNLRDKTEEQQRGLASSKIKAAEGQDCSVSPNAVESPWFGNAADFRKKLCQTHRWAHSEDCELNPNFEECLDYRFLVPLKGQLPTHFVVTSSVYDKMREWFSSRGYVVEFGPVFDSIVAESPRGKVLWQSYYILERQSPVRSAAFA